MADSEPDWGKLPNNPEAFFELSKGWERRDLKRAYNRLIKQFRPEREPERFRQIRAAYERLTQQLEWREAHGEPDEEETVSNEDSTWMNELDRQADQSQPAESNPAPAFEIRVPLNDDEEQNYLFWDSGTHWGRARTQMQSWLEARASPSDICQRLEREPAEHQDDENYWLRMLLSDLDDPTGRQFFNSLVEALVDKPRASLFQQTIGTYLRDRDDELDPMELLAHAREKLLEGLHYAMLLPLWLDIFDADQDAFWKLFSSTTPSFQCQGGFVYFQLQFLGHRAMEMPLDKFQQQLEQVDSHHDMLPPQAHEHLDFLHGIRAYRELSKSAPAQTDGMKMLEEAIGAFANPETWKRSREILLELSRNTNYQWFDKHFPNEHPLLAPASELVMYMTHHLDLPQPELMQDHERAQQLHGRLNRHLFAAFKTTDKLRTSFKVWITIMGRMAYKLGVNIVAPIAMCGIVNWLFPDLFAEAGFFFVIGFLLAFILGYKYKLNEYEYYIGRKPLVERDRKYYRDFWREYLLDFIAQNKTTSTIVLNLIHVNEQPDSPSLFDIASGDAGLPLFSSLVAITKGKRR